MPITSSSFRGGNAEERAMPMDDDEDDRAKPGQTVKLKPRKKGQKPISFQQGGLHESLGVPQDEPIPPEKMASALKGNHGPKAQQQANFAQNVLKKGQQTAAKAKK